MKLVPIIPLYTRTVLGRFLPNVLRVEIGRNNVARLNSMTGTIEYKTKGWTEEWITKHESTLLMEQNVDP